MGRSYGWTSVNSLTHLIGVCIELKTIVSYVFLLKPVPVRNVLATARFQICGHVNVLSDYKNQEF